MPNPLPEKNKIPYARTKVNPYPAWYLSSLGVVVIIAGALTYIAGTIYLTSEKMVNSSNKKIVETAGIEITVELKKKDLDVAKQIVARKSIPLEIPSRLRNIFQFNSYVGEAPSLSPGAVTSTTNPPL
jgi:hypothetical protein